MVKKDKNKALIIIVLLVVAIIFFLSYKVKDDSAFEITYYDKDGEIISTDSATLDSLENPNVFSTQSVFDGTGYFCGGNCINKKNDAPNCFDSLQECFNNNKQGFRNELASKSVDINKKFSFNQPPKTATSASLKIRIVNDGNVPLVFSVSDFMSRYTQIG